MKRNTPGIVQGKRNGWHSPLVLLVLLAVLALSMGESQSQNFSQTSPSPPNRLIKETSPYLRLHAHNPVDWYPWGSEALQRARRENKPIFLSIGYSTCHWCHVMARECFENPVIARLMNENFINIKVDREERPDLDETYMQAVIMVTGEGGWPMSVFLTADLKPFFGGTYFPPEKFKELLVALSQAYRQDQAEVLRDAQTLQERLMALEKIADPGQNPDGGVLNKAFSRLSQTFDAQYGGFDGAPKFPQALELNFLLYYYRYTGAARAREMVGLSLEKIARGGIYDQLGGGFHRYATDSRWQIPHFEKMLYDNALLASLYLPHSQLSGSEEDRRVARETLDFVLRDLGAPAGGFYAALDSQSDGKEGKYYVWSLDEVKQVVGGQAAALVIAALGVTKKGNFEGMNVLTRPLSTSELASRFSLTGDQVNRTLSTALDQLRQARARRVSPARDDKIIVSWNGLTITALARGAQVLGDQRYYQAAAQGARFILQNLVKDGRLQRIWAGGKASIPAFLDDYAFLVNSLIDLFETDFDPAWLTAAQGLVKQMEDLFLNSREGVYFYVGQDQPTPLGRNQSIYDQSIPSGNAMAALACWRLYRFTEDSHYQKRAQAILIRFQGQMDKVPLGFPQLLSVQILYLTQPLDLTLVGDPSQLKTQEMLKEMYRHFLPERRLVLKNQKAAAALEKVVPEVRDYTLSGGKPVAYICRNFACLAPITAPEELLARLKKIDSEGTRAPSSGIPGGKPQK
jgi:uncharacterized protein YyaL (SSP411 family)